ncbi:methyl-accepting chemotaxis protein [Psychromonas sp.]|nr:methyl-accepting chemotaxis protein [Psychromonas sp.]
MFHFSIQKKFNLLLTLIGLVILIISIMSNNTQQKKLVEETIQSNLKLIAGNYFDSINTLMLTGTMANKSILENKIRNEKNIEEAKIIRSDLVKKYYGAGIENNKAENQAEQAALNGIESMNISNKGDKRVLTYLKPIIGTENYNGTNCLSCHMSKTGEVLGVIKLSYSLGESDQIINKNNWFNGILLSAIFFIAFLTLALIFRRLLFQRLKRVGAVMQDIYEGNNLTLRIHDTSNDELGRLSQNFNAMLDRFLENMQKVAHTSTILNQAADKILNSAQNTESAIKQQNIYTESVVIAINHLKESSKQVKNTSDDASQSTASGGIQAEEGMQIVKTTQYNINQLAEEVRSASEKVDNLEIQTEEVGKVLQIISNIAEQTNLLALNAAIEAARAGESGRGFAVVADEVRTLASNTQNTTLQIKQTIERLQSEAKQTVEVMSQSALDAEQRAEQVEQVTDTLNKITQHMQDINQLSIQIAAETEQQDQASEEISRNVEEIAKSAETSLLDATDSKSISLQLQTVAKELSNEVRLFKLK